jgi:hypothetical protein
MGFCAERSVPESYSITTAVERTAVRLAIV